MVNEDVLPNDFKIKWLYVIKNANTFHTLVGVYFSILQCVFGFYNRWHIPRSPPWPKFSLANFTKALDVLFSQMRKMNDESYLEATFPKTFFFVPFLTLFEELKGLERKWALCVKALSLKYIIHLLLGLLKIPHLPLIFHPFSRRQHWDEVVKHYYDVFNRTLAEFGLVLRHLGTSYNDFLYEVKRALRGQFLCVAVIIPIGKSK